MQVIVAHPDTQHSLHAAVGLKRAGLLRFLFTSVSLRRPRWLGTALRSFAPGAYRRLAQHRLHSQLCPDELRVFPSHLLSMRMGEAAWFRSQLRFGRRAAEMGARERCAVMAFNTNAVETFRMLKRERLPCILDQTIAHRRWSDRVGQAECDAFPEWGDHWAAPSWRADLEDEEIALADLVLCGSDFCAETLVAEGTPADKIAVAEYGADLERFSPLPDPRTGSGVRLLFVGSLALRKGVHYLVEAAHRLERLGVRLSLVGDRRVRSEALARYSGVVSTVPFRLHGEMPALYREHDIYVFPSLVEGSSLSIYEAMAAGLPVVTTPNAGSIVRDGLEGLVVPPRDVQALAAAVERLVRDRDMRVEMGRAARRRAESYGSWEHYGERLVRAVAPFLDEGRA